MKGKEHMEDGDRVDILAVVLGVDAETARTIMEICRVADPVQLYAKYVAVGRTDSLFARALAGTDGRKPVLVAGGFLVYDSWLRNPLVHETGELTLPVPGEEIQGGHCMAIVGYADDPDALRYPGGGYFIVRNSWGAEWAAGSEEGAGYARVPYAFIGERHMTEACAVRSWPGGMPGTDRPPAPDRLAAVRKRLDRK